MLLKLENEMRVFQKARDRQRRGERERESEGEKLREKNNIVEKKMAESSG